MRAIESPTNQFLKVIEVNATKSVVDRGDTHYRPCDELVMAAAIKESHMITDKVTCYADVETGGLMTRGQMVVDWKLKFGKTPNVTLILSMNSEEYCKLLTDTAYFKQKN